MKNKIILYHTIPFVSIVFSSCITEYEKDITPNIIYIYADDLGIGDIGCYGQQYIKTPNIDRLAEEGIRFTQHYTGAPISAPARSSLITGKHSGNSYIRNNYELIDKSDSKTGQLPLPEGTFTVAKLLKNKNYVTAVFGKWGLGSIESSGHPNKQGFDLFFGYADQVHAHNHYPTFLWRNSEKVFLDNDVESVHPRYASDEQFNIHEEYKKFIGNDYSLDILTEEVISFMDVNKENPFFIYLPYIVPHKALQVPDESLEYYKGVFEENSYDGKGSYTPHPKPLSAYAAMITRMDEKVGEIMDFLIEASLDENTIVMFSSDNGPAGGGGLDTRFFNSSAGLRGGKGQVYEGGIRVPFIVRWPGKISPGTTTNHISAQYDLMATIAELTGQEITDTDGISFLPTLIGNNKNQKQHEYLYWEFSGRKQFAVRIGDLKGIKSEARNAQDSKWEIYNIKKDKVESNNIVNEHIELINRFEEIISKRTPSHIPEWNF